MHLSIARVAIYIATAAGVLVALQLGIRTGQGQGLTALTFLLAIAGAAVALRMDRNVWMLLPLAFAVNVDLLPFSGRMIQAAELLTLPVSLLLLARLAFQRESMRLRLADTYPVLLYFLWLAVFFVFLKPVGFYVFGASTAGARMYVRLALAFFACFVLANQEVSEKSAKWIIRFILLGSIVLVVQAAVSFRAGIAPDIIEVDQYATYYTWHQSLSLPAMYVMLWLISRYRPAEVFSFSWRFPVLLAMIGLGLYSGKRAVAACVLAAPLLAAFIAGKRQAAVLYGGAAAVALASLVIISTITPLPLRVQRSLCNLPGKWNPEIAREATTPYRLILRRGARRLIAENPIAGKKGIALDAEVAYELSKNGATDVEIAGTSYGSSWHNTWLGIAADFGIPASVLWGVFCLVFLRLGFRLYRQTEHGTYRHTLVSMVLLWHILTLMRSWTSGHSMLNAYDAWWQYGVLVGIKYTPKKAPVKEPRPAPLETRAPVAPAGPATITPLPRSLASARNA